MPFPRPLIVSLGSYRYNFRAYRISRVVRLQDSEISTAGDVLARSFFNDRMVAYMLISSLLRLIVPIALILLIVFLFIQPVLGQVQERIIPFPEWSALLNEEEIALE